MPTVGQHAQGDQQGRLRCHQASRNGTTGTMTSATLSPGCCHAPMEHQSNEGKSTRKLHVFAGKVTLVLDKA